MVDMSKITYLFLMSYLFTNLSSLVFKLNLKLINIRLKLNFFLKSNIYA